MLKPLSRYLFRLVLVMGVPAGAPIFNAATSRVVQNNNSKMLEYNNIATVLYLSRLLFFCSLLIRKILNYTNFN